MSWCSSSEELTSLLRSSSSSRCRGGAAGDERPRRGVCGGQLTTESIMIPIAGENSVPCILHRSSQMSEGNVRTLAFPASKKLGEQPLLLVGWAIHYYSLNWQITFSSDCLSPLASSTIRRSYHHCLISYHTPYLIGETARQNTIQNGWREKFSTFYHGARCSGARAGCALRVRIAVRGGTCASAAWCGCMYHVRITVIQPRAAV
jgi:hypothetical protein